MTSAPANGLATTVKREKYLICVNSGQRKLKILLPRILLGMPAYPHHHASFNVVTWTWNRERSNENRGQKRSLPESTDVSSTSQDGTQEEVEDGLKMWGYMPGHVHYHLSKSEGDVRKVSSSLELD